MYKNVIACILLGISLSCVRVHATTMAAKDILSLSMHGVTANQMIEWPAVSSIPDNLLSAGPLEWAEDYSEAYADVAADWIDSLRMREPSDASVSITIGLSDTLNNVASVAGIDASGGGEVRATLVVRLISALGSGNGAPATASEEAGFLPPSIADLLASKATLSGSGAPLIDDGQGNYKVHIGEADESTPTTLSIDFACAAFVTIRQTLEISVLLEHRADPGSDWQIESITAPSSYQLYKRCTAQECGDLCEAHGTCLSEIGFCECDDTWYGLECEFQFVFPSEACPGDELPMDFFLPATHFANIDWMAFVRADSDDIFEQADWMYLSTLSQSVENDGVLEVVEGSYTFHTFLSPGEHRFLLFLEDGTEVGVEFPFNILDYADERCSASFQSALATATKCLTDASFVMDPLCSALDCTAEDVCDAEMQCAFDECECRGSRFGAACERGCDEEVTYDAQEVIVSTDVAMAAADDPTTFVAYYANEAACVFNVVPADGADEFEVAVSVSEFVDEDFVSLVSVTEAGEVVEEIRVFSAADDGTGTFTVRANALRFELSTSSTGQARGLYAKVTAMHDPVLSPAGLAILIICILLLVTAIVAAVVFFVRRFLRKKALAAERASLLPALTLVDVTGAAEALADLKKKAHEMSSPRKKKKAAAGDADVPLDASVSELNLASMESDLLLEVNPRTKRNLLFGLGATEALPVNQWCTDTIVLRNTRADGQPVTFAFLVDECTDQYEVSVQPGCGVVAANSEVRVVVKLRLFYTCRLDRFLTVAASVGAHPFFEDEQVALDMDELLQRGSKDGEGNADIEMGSTRAKADAGDGAKAAKTERQARESVLRTLNVAASEWLQKANPTYGAFRLRFDGALSDRIDPDELELIGDPLASGAFGVVYKGSYRGTTCAVKILKQQQELMENQIADFEREIDIFRRLRSPYILGFVGASHVSHKMCLCTELMEHGSIAKLLFEFRPAFALKTKYLLDAANALQYLHANLVIYRDVKVDNFLVWSTNYTAKVACKLGDFGTAKSVTSTSERAAHTGGLGTVAYMAPELLEGTSYDAKVDVFAFAMMMYEMYTQQSPWRGVKVWDVPNLVLSGERPELPSDMPKPYRALMWKCWANDSAKRPTSDEVVADIEVIFKAAKKERSKEKASGRDRTHTMERRATVDEEERHRSGTLDASMGTVEGFKHQPTLTGSETDTKSKLASMAATAQKSTSPRKKKKTKK